MRANGLFGETGHFKSVDASQRHGTRNRNDLSIASGKSRIT